MAIRSLSVILFGHPFWPWFVGIRVRIDVAHHGIPTSFYRFIFITMHPHTFLKRDMVCVFNNSVVCNTRTRTDLKGNIGNGQENSTRKI